jgi:hydrogenase/urease accessory protein HupE
MLLVPRLILLLIFSLTGQAHSLQVTGVVVRIEAGITSVSVVAHSPLLAGADPQTAIARRLRMRLDGRPFVPKDISIARDAANDTVTWTAQERRAPGTINFDAPMFPDQRDDTTVVLVYRDGMLAARAMLDPGRPTALVGENLPTVIRRFIEQGINHIFTGPDHILFIVGLILVGGSLKRLFAVVTAFTLAHSLTLSLTVLGYSSVSPRLVEPVIALSIIAVGMENLLHRKSDFELRVWLAFGFGFFHGFGFAGALVEVGLPRQALGWSLASFNVGVEIAQASIVLTAVPLLNLLHRRNSEGSELLTKYASMLIAAAGFVWFLQRVFA